MHYQPHKRPMLRANFPQHTHRETMPSQRNATRNRPSMTKPPEKPGEPVDSATEVLGNALRRYRDAKLLFEHGRYPSCVSLSVLAIEELAKFMALAGYQPLPSSGWQNHVNKQQNSAAFLLRKRYQAELREIIAEQELDEPDDTYKRWADMDFADD